MYYFTGTVRVRDGLAQLHADETLLFLGGRAAQRRYRYYLWSAWRSWWLHEQHGHEVDFFLNQPVTDFGNIARAILGTSRVYNSVGVVPLILRLYTDGEKTHVGFGDQKGRPGNLRRLPAALDQLELTYDVYGMDPDALLEILPEPFHAWAAR